MIEMTFAPRRKKIASAVAALHLLVAASAVAAPSGFDARELHALCTKANFDRDADGAIVRSKDGAPLLSKQRALQFLLQRYIVSDAARDENGDGTVAWNESIRAIVYVDSCGPRDPMHESCAENDRENLQLLRKIIGEFVGYAQQSTSFSIAGKAGAVAFGMDHTSATSDSSHFEAQSGDRPQLSDTDIKAEAYEFFKRPQSVTVACTGFSLANEPTSTPQPASDKGKKENSWTRAGRLRSSPDDLFDALDDDNKKTLKGATFSYEDKAGGASKLSADMVAGVAFVRSLARGGRVVAVPFVDVEASNLSGKSVDDPDRLGVGVGLSWLALDGLAGVPWNLAGYWEHLTDTGFSASMDYLKFVLQPTPDINCFNTFTSTGILPIGYFCEADLRADVGLVESDGGAPSFVKLDRGYARLGYRLALSIRGAPADNLDWISANVSFQQMHDFSGHGRHLERFDASLELAPSELQLFQQDAVVGVVVGYTNGEADETLEKQNKVTVGFSITY